MRGVIFRLGVSLKEAGEKIGINWLIRFGLSIRDFAMDL